MKRYLALLSAILFTACAGSGTTKRHSHSPAATGHAYTYAPRAARAAGYSAPYAKSAPARAERGAPSRAADSADFAPSGATTPSAHGDVTRSAPPASEAPPPIAQARARLLTAASVADTDRFENYASYLQRRRYLGNQLGLRMTRRLRVRVLDANGKPVNGASIRVQASQGSPIVGTTHADGYWDFFPGVSAPHMAGSASITVTAGQTSSTVGASIPSHGDGGTVLVRLAGVSAIAPTTLDLGFVIDVTGSMGDELRYVNREVRDIVRRIKKSVPNTRVRVGAVFYRDRQDSVPLQKLAFTEDVESFRRTMRTITASGGGDYPEDMDAGLATAMTGLRWTRGNAARVMVLLADAPPKYYANAQYRYADAMKDASRRGIRILPVAASGANRTVEYLFRAMGAFTSTPYTYLTNDSGVGGHHMEADTDRVGVESFNDLLTRLIISDLRGQGMHEPGPLGPRGQR